MARPQKKRLRKVKDKIIHAANDIKTEMTDKDTLPAVKEHLEEVRSSLIESTNWLTKALNFNPK